MNFQDIPQDVYDMIQQSERIYVDYKKELTNNFGNHIMAFANRYGGHILVGVAENILPDGSQTGKLDGFESQNIDVDKRRVEHYARDLHPSVTLLKNQEYQLQGGRWLLHIHVKEQTEKPVGTVAGLYKIRTHTGNNPMDHAAMRAAIFEEKRALNSLRSCLYRNVKHANQVLQSINIDNYPMTVFEKVNVLAALSAPDVYKKVDQSKLSVVYQAYEVVDRSIMIKLNWRPIGGKSEDVHDIIKESAKKAVDLGKLLIDEIDEILKQSTYA